MVLYPKNICMWLGPIFWNNLSVCLVISWATSKASLLDQKWKTAKLNLFRWALRGQHKWSFSMSLQEVHPRELRVMGSTLQSETALPFPLPCVCECVRPKKQKKNLFGWYMSWSKFTFLIAKSKYDESELLVTFHFTFIRKVFLLYYLY